MELSGPLKITHDSVGAAAPKPDHSRFCRGHRPPAPDQRGSIGAAALLTYPFVGAAPFTHDLV